MDWASIIVPAIGAMGVGALLITIWNSYRAPKAESNKQLLDERQQERENSALMWQRANEDQARLNVEHAKLYDEIAEVREELTKTRIALAESQFKITMQEREIMRLNTEVDYLALELRKCTASGALLGTQVTQLTAGLESFRELRLRAESAAAQLSADIKRNILLDMPVDQVKPPPAIEAGAITAE